MPRILGEFQQRHSQVMLRIYDHSASEIADHVEKGEAEFGISIISAARWDLDIMPLGKECFVIACPAGHPFCGEDAVGWSDIEGLPLIRIGPETGNRILIDEALGGRREKMNWRYEVQHIATTIGFVRAGLALALMPEFVLKGADVPGLVGVPLRNPTVTRTLGMLTRKGVPLSPAAEDLRSIIVHQFRTWAGGAEA